MKAFRLTLTHPTSIRSLCNQGSFHLEVADSTPVGTGAAQRQANRHALPRIRVDTCLLGYGIEVSTAAYVGYTDRDKVVSSTRGQGSIDPQFHDEEKSVRAAHLARP